MPRHLPGRNIRGVEGKDNLDSVNSYAGHLFLMPQEMYVKAKRRLSLFIHGHSRHNLVEQLALDGLKRLYLQRGAMHICTAHGEMRYQIACDMEGVLASRENVAPIIVSTSRMGKRSRPHEVFIMS